MSSPSAALKVNYLIIRYLYFRSVRGDLQDGNGCASRCQSPSSRAQNRGFCALLPSGTPIFGRPEHKIGVFVLFWPPEPTFSGISSTKSAFLCQNWQFSPGFCPFRAQNRGFCALLPFGTPVFGCFEHIICIFVLGVTPAALSQMTLVQFYRWGDAAAEALNRCDDSRWGRCQWAAGRRPLGR